MALKHKLETLEGLDETTAALYKAVDGAFVLDIEDLDTADELKGAYERTKEDRNKLREQLAAIEAEKAEKEAAERERMEQAQEHEKLYQSEKAKSEKARTELEALKQKIARREVDDEVDAIVTGLTTDERRLRLLQREAREFVQHTPDGVVITGADGETLNREQLAKHLAETNPFLVDGSKASGGGANGAQGGGGSNKKFDEYTSGELSQIRQTDPAEYERLKNQHYGT